MTILFTAFQNSLTYDRILKHLVKLSNLAASASSSFHVNTSSVIWNLPFWLALKSLTEFQCTSYIIKYVTIPHKSNALHHLSSVQKIYSNNSTSLTQRIKWNILIILYSLWPFEFKTFWSPDIYDPKVISWSHIFFTHCLNCSLWLTTALDYIQ